MALSAAVNGVSSSGVGGGTESTDESSVSSAEWLRRHGIAARRLGFYDVLAGAAFKHEDGVLDLKVAPPCDDDHVMDAVSIIRSLYRVSNAAGNPDNLMEICKISWKFSDWVCV